MKKGLVGFLAILCLMVSGGYVWAETTQRQLDEKQEEVSGLEDEIAAQKNELKKLKGQEQNIENELRILEIELETTELELKAAEAQLQQVELEIEYTIEQIEKNTEKLEISVVSYRGQLAQSYMFSRTSSIEILMNSDSISDFSRNMKYMDVIEEENQRLIYDIAELKRNLEEQKVALEQKRQEVEVIKEQVLAKSHELEEKKWVKEQLLSRIRQQQITYAELVQKSQAAYNQLNNEIAQLEERLRQEELERQRQQEAQGNVQPPAPAPVGGYAWPARGTITMYFWEEYPEWVRRLYPGLPRNHTGLDIANATGTPVYAAHGGTVVLVRDYGWGYGRTIMIDHGGGLMTLYAHLNGFNVSQGQSVSAGQQIATMGSTGNSSGPHLHLEFRLNGSYVNPLNYLP